MLNIIEKIGALREHMHALTRYAAGFEPAPQPDIERARAMVQSYHLLVEENYQLHLEVGSLRMHDRMMALADMCPALERWRALILESPRRSPLEKAAAWELTALAEEMHGNLFDAELARGEAAACIPNDPPSEVAA